MLISNFKSHISDCRLLLLLAMAIFAGLALAGCGSDFDAELVIEGQPAPFRGVVVGPDLIVEEGQPVPISGAILGGDLVEDVLEEVGR